jgi:hypothetical protein
VFTEAILIGEKIIHELHGQLISNDHLHMKEVPQKKNNINDNFEVKCVKTHVSSRDEFISSLHVSI